MWVLFLFFFPLISGVAYFPFHGFIFLTHIYHFVNTEESFVSFKMQLQRSCINFPAFVFIIPSTITATTILVAVV